MAVLVPDAESLREEALAGPAGAQGFLDLGVGWVLGQLELGEGDSVDVQGSGFFVEAGEGICRLVLRARQILGVEVEVGEPFPPPFELAGLASTAWLQESLERLVIRPEGELLSQEELLPVLHGQQTCQGFPLVRCVVPLGAGQGLVEAGNRSFFAVLSLGESSPNPDVGRIRGDEGWGPGVEDVEVELLHRHPFQGLEGKIAGIRPLEWGVLPGQRAKRFGDVGESWKEILVEVDHPQEGLDFLDSPGCGCFLDWLQVGRVWPESVMADEMSEGGDRRLGEGALSQLEAKVMVGQGGEGSSEGSVVGDEVFAVDDDVVDVDDDSLDSGEGLMDQPLEDGGRILQAHGQPLVSPEAQRGEGGCQVSGVGVEGDMEISLLQIQLGEDRCSCQLDVQVLDVGERVSLRDDERVEGCEVRGDAHPPIRLGYCDESMGPLGSLDRFPDPCCIHLLNFGVDGVPSAEGDGAEVGNVGDCVR